MFLLRFRTPRPGRATGLYGSDSCLEVFAKVTPYREESTGDCALHEAHERWSERLPGEADALWCWCLGQDWDTLLDLLAYSTARAVNAVQAKHDHPTCERIAHANALATALKLDMTKWFAPTALNYFSRVGRATIVSAMAEAKAHPPSLRGTS